MELDPQTQRLVDQAIGEMHLTDEQESDVRLLLELAYTRGHRRSLEEMLARKKERTG